MDDLGTKNKIAIETLYVRLGTNYGQFMDNLGTNYGRKSDQSIGWNFAIVHKICGR